MSLEVSTVSRKTESWWAAPGAIDVLTDEDIRRFGALSIPDALRYVTGLQVSQPNAREWAISARGFDVVAASKMNVQIDGRAVYTPFFSGVLWDVQDTVLADIDRIEVLRGPSGALWGAYAVNGFIQILTKPAWETQGWLADAKVGTENPGTLALRYGGKVGNNIFYRAYLKYSQYDWTYVPYGGRSHPSSDMVQAGFRLDSRSDADTTLTLHGDIYTDKGTPRDNSMIPVSGGNLGAQWRRNLGLDSDVQFSGYYDQTSRTYGGPFYEDRDTLSSSAKYRVTKGRHEFQVGGDSLISWDDIRSPSAATIQPPKKTYSSVGVFAQDTIALVPSRWTATLGAKAERTTFASWDAQPTARLAWTPNSRLTVWGAISRAVRPPVRIDEGLDFKVGDLQLFKAQPTQKSETVLATELGVRRMFGERLAVDISGFANKYDDLRSYEYGRTPSTFPWTFGNSTDARSLGVELTAMYQPLSRVFVKASYRYMDLQLTKDPGSLDFRNGLFEQNDARQVGSITVRTEPATHFELDATVRFQSSLPQPYLPGFITCDARIGWAPNASWEVSLIARNLSDPRHPEFLTPNSANEEVARSFLLRITWRY